MTKRCSVLRLRVTSDIFTEDLERLLEACDKLTHVTEELVLVCEPVTHLALKVIHERVRLS